MHKFEKRGIELPADLFAARSSAATCRAWRLGETRRRLQAPPVALAALSRRSLRLRGAAARRVTEAATAGVPRARVRAHAARAATGSTASDVQRDRERRAGRGLTVVAADRAAGAAFGIVLVDRRQQEHARRADRRVRWPRRGRSRTRNAEPAARPSSRSTRDSQTLLALHRRRRPKIDAARSAPAPEIGLLHAPLRRARRGDRPDAQPRSAAGVDRPALGRRRTLGSNASPREAIAEGARGRAFASSPSGCARGPSTAPTLQRLAAGTGGAYAEATSPRSSRGSSTRSARSSANEYLVDVPARSSARRARARAGRRRARDVGRRPRLRDAGRSSSTRAASNGRSSSALWHVADHDAPRRACSARRLLASAVDRRALRPRNSLLRRRDVGVRHAAAPRRAEPATRRSRGLFAERTRLVRAAPLVGALQGGARDRRDSDPARADRALDARSVTLFGGAGSLPRSSGRRCFALVGLAVAVRRARRDPDEARARSARLFERAAPRQPPGARVGAARRAQPRRRALGRRRRRSRAVADASSSASSPTSSSACRSRTRSARWSRANGEPRPRAGRAGRGAPARDGRQHRRGARPRHGDASASASSSGGWCARSRRRADCELGRLAPAGRPADHDQPSQSRLHGSRCSTSRSGDMHARRLRR